MAAGQPTGLPFTQVQARAGGSRIEVGLLAQLLRSSQMSAQRFGVLSFLDGGSRIVHGRNYARLQGGCLEGFA
ncbi:MAG: hypothetical protein AW10_00741 [Candidatus Accumulibacter appositus]|uniref:Uncharacterized protein n=1 Tax=Candidatus Accumulibacter appositus TaxID=1454003 RepID=A0A011NHN4_9PROT|nr:MAG: hypothetical protein AW10_00741 [Candidatus Accumulibacter appositus]